MQGNALEEGWIFPVAEDNVLKGNIALQLVRLFVRYAGLSPLRSTVKHFLNALSTRCGITGQRGQLGEITHRLVQHLEKGEEQNQCPNVNSRCANGNKTKVDSLACGNIASYTQDDDGPKHSQERNERGELGLQPATMQPSLPLCPPTAPQ